MEYFSEINTIKYTESKSEISFNLNFLQMYESCLWNRFGKISCTVAVRFNLVIIHFILLSAVAAAMFFVHSQLCNFQSPIIKTKPNIETVSYTHLRAHET